MSSASQREFSDQYIYSDTILTPPDDKRLSPEVIAYHSGSEILELDSGKNSASSTKESFHDPIINTVMSGPTLTELVPTTKMTSPIVSKIKSSRFNLSTKESWNNCVASSLSQLVSISCPSSPKNGQNPHSTQSHIKESKLPLMRIQQPGHCDDLVTLLTRSRSQSVITPKNQFKSTNPDVSSLNINEFRSSAGPSLSTKLESKILRTSSLLPPIQLKSTFIRDSLNLPLSHLSSTIIKETPLHPMDVKVKPRKFSMIDISPRGENRRKYVIMGEGIRYGGIVDYKAEFYIVETGINLSISSHNVKDEWFVVSIFPASKAKISIERCPYPKDAKILIHTNSMKDKNLIEKRINSLTCYKVSYIIPNPGTFQINVTCRGTNVDNSPYTIAGIPNKLKTCLKILNSNFPSILKAENSKLKKRLVVDDVNIRRLASIGIILICTKKMSSLRKHWSTLIKTIENEEDDIIIRNLIYLLILILSKDKVLTVKMFIEETFKLIKKRLDQNKNKQINAICAQFIACLINVEREMFNSGKILNEVKDDPGYQMFFNLLYSSDIERKDAAKKLFGYLFSSYVFRHRVFNKNYFHNIIKIIRNDELSDLRPYLIKNTHRGRSTYKSSKLPMVDFNNPDEYDKLQIGELLSLGASALIKKGIYRGRDVVIKVFDKLHISFSIKTFYIELSIMNHLTHPNIMPCIGACTKEDSLYIVMNHIKLGSIYDMIHGNGSSCESRLIHLINLRRWTCFISIAKQISLGMEHLHKYQVIHRDLKSHNILLSDDGLIKTSSSGINYQVKLIDFGTCRDNDNTRHMTGATGTIQWCAPEVLNHGIYGLSADVYSFGIVLWELLTHQVPYHYMPIYKIADSVIHHNLRPQIPENCPYFLRSLLNICWHANPKRRPTFRQLAKDFDKIDQQYLTSQLGRLPKLPLQP